MSSKKLDNLLSENILVNIKIIEKFFIYYKWEKNKNLKKKLEPEFFSIIFRIL